MHVTIRHVHIRYEDADTLAKPFSFGFSIDSIIIGGAESTKQDGKILRKLTLNSIAIYMNSPSSLYETLLQSEIYEKLLEDIAGDGGTKSPSKYILLPLSLDSELFLDPNPSRNNFINAMADILISLKKFELMLTKVQYDTIYMTMQELNRQMVQFQYRKYRPSGLDKLGPKRKWEYAIEVVKQELVKKRLKEWNPKLILVHLQSCKRYRELYAKRLAKKILKEGELKELDKMEAELDVFTILFCRQQSQLMAAKILEADKAARKGTWLGWVWSTAPEQQQESSSSSQFDYLISSEETEKLKQAIEFEENERIHWPEAYEKFRIDYRLDNFSIRLLSEDNQQVGFVEFLELHIKIGFRPHNKAVSFEYSLRYLEINGALVDNFSPKILITHSPGETENGQQKALFYSRIEWNPTTIAEGGSKEKQQVDFSIMLDGQPLIIFFDHSTVQAVQEFLKPPKVKKSLKIIAQMIRSQMKQARQLTIVGLQRFVSTRMITLVDLKFAPTRLVLPEMGSFRNANNALLFATGGFHLNNRRQLEKTITTTRNVSEDFETLRAAAYNTYDISISDTFISYISQENLELLERVRNHQPGHDPENTILNPLKFSFIFSNTDMRNNPDFPRALISGELNKFHINLSDQLIAKSFLLIKSIPEFSPKQELDQLEKDNKSEQRSTTKIEKSSVQNMEQIRENLKLDKTYSFVRPVETNLDPTYIEKVLSKIQAKNISMLKGLS